MPGGRKSELFAREFRLLQRRIGRHAVLFVSPGQTECGMAQIVKPREGNELEFIAHRAQLSLECPHLVTVHVVCPIEGGGAIVREHLIRMHLPNSFSEAFGVAKARCGSLAPNQVGVGSVRNPTRYRSIKPSFEAVKALFRTIPGDKGGIGLVDIGSPDPRSGVGRSDRG